MCKVLLDISPDRKRCLAALFASAVVSPGTAELSHQRKDNWRTGVNIMHSTARADGRLPPGPNIKSGRMGDCHPCGRPHRSSATAPGSRGGPQGM